MTRNRPPSLTDFYVEDFERKIANGEYKPGQKLPSETALAKELGISRPLVREILGRLRDRGRIETYNGRGSFVRAETPESMIDTIIRHAAAAASDPYTADDLYTARRLVEVEAAGLCAINASEQQLDTIAGYYQAMLAADGDVEQHMVADMQFHLEIAKGSRNPLLVAFLGPITQVVGEGMLQSLKERPEGMSGGIRGHAVILEALRARGAEQSREAMAKHMDYSRSTFPALLIS